MSENAAAVVVFTAEESRTFEYSGLAFTYTTARVSEVIRGSVPQPTFTLRQLGTTSEAVEDWVPVVRAGETYVAFVLDDALPGHPSSYSIAGQTGLLHLDGSTGRATHMDPLPYLPDLPSTIALPDLRALVNDEK